MCGQWNASEVPGEKGGCCHTVTWTTRTVREVRGVKSYMGGH